MHYLCFRTQIISSLLEIVDIPAIRITKKEKFMCLNQLKSLKIQSWEKSKKISWLLWTFRDIRLSKSQALVRINLVDTEIDAIQAK